MSEQAVGARGMGSYVVDGGSEPFAENVLDFRHSVVQAHKRADAGDDSLEICPHCMCEVDVTPQPHRPGCAGIGQPRSTVLTGHPTYGLDALERMDAGEPQQPEPHGEPERLAATDEREHMIECKVDGCDGDASDAPKAGPTARLCATHRAERGAEISASRLGRRRNSGGATRPKPKRKTSTAKPKPAVAAVSSTNGSHASKAERLIAAARAVDDAEAALAAAKASLANTVQEFV